MIKVYVNRYAPDGKGYIEIDGTVEELAEDVGNVAYNIFHLIKEKSPEIAPVFKQLLQELFADDGSVWIPIEEMPEED